MKYTVDEKTRKLNFLKVCIENRNLGFSLDKKIKKLYTNCGEDIELFAKAIVDSDDREIILSQEYALSSKLLDDGKHNDRIMKMIGDKWISTASDAGSLKIGNDNFSILIPNGYGDGRTLYSVVNSSDFNMDMMKYFTLIEGKFSIYSFDCGNNRIETIEGKYQIFHSDGLVVFVKM
jgi:hypothetical protein